MNIFVLHNKISNQLKYNLKLKHHKHTFQAKHFTQISKIIGLLKQMLGYSDIFSVQICFEGTACVLTYFSLYSTEIVMISGVLFLKFSGMSVTFVICDP